MKLRRPECSRWRIRVMAAQATIAAPRPKAAFPLKAVQDLLRRDLTEAAEESSVLHPGWEPVLDSLRIVTVVTAIEDLLKIKLPPEKCIRRGGYRSVGDGVKDMAERIRCVWNRARK
jgi:acyl carrier protein